MGVLGALYLPLCRDEAFKAELKESLNRYSAFVTRELEDDSGVVHGSVGRKDPGRLYNFPWVARFHLAMYRATGVPAQLDRFVRVMRSSPPFVCMTHNEFSVRLVAHPWVHNGVVTVPLYPRRQVQMMSKHRDPKALMRYDHGRENLALSGVA